MSFLFPSFGYVGDPGTVYSQLCTAVRGVDKKVCFRCYMPVNSVGIHTEGDLFLKSQDMASVFEVFWLGSVVNGINVAAFTLKIILRKPAPFNTLIC